MTVQISDVQNEAEEALCRYVKVLARIGVTTHEIMQQVQGAIVDLMDQLDELWKNGEHLCDIDKRLLARQYGTHIDLLSDPNDPSASLPLDWEDKYNQISIDVIEKYLPIR